MCLNAKSSEVWLCLSLKSLRQSFSSPSKKQFKHKNKIYIYSYDFMQSDTTNKTPLNILIFIHINFMNNNGAAK